jgi:hypothetical protein
MPIKGKSMISTSLRVLTLSLSTASLLNHSAEDNRLQSTLNGRGRKTRNAPAYRVIPLNVANSACETSQSTINFPLESIPTLKAIPLIKGRLYFVEIGVKGLFSSSFDRRYSQ